MWGAAMVRVNLALIATIVVAVLLVSAIGTVLYYDGLSSKNPSTATPTPNSAATITPQPTPTPEPTATPNSKLIVTYFEQSRNQTMIAIEFKLEPNSYIFQWNASSFYLLEGGVKISANINDVIIIGNQYSTLFFPINNYQGTDYHLASDKLPADTIWIKQ
jgi:hypothetical protein